MTSIAVHDASSADDASLLVVLLDTTPEAWGSRAPLTLHKCVEHVVVFTNAFLLLHNRNRVALIAMHVDGCHILYESPDEQQQQLASNPSKVPVERSAGRVGDTIFRRLKEMIGQDSTTAGAHRPPSMSGALSMALCYIQRRRAGLQPRVLCMTASPDPPAQYISVMNALFAAQRTGVIIDGCPVGGQDSAFLQQAAHLTKGIYLRPPRLDGLLQYLLSVFAVDTFSRTFLEIPRSSGVDFRASCFCHKRSIDLGYVCSVCLSIFCQSCESCTTCGTQYTPKALPSKRTKLTPPEIAA